MTRTFAATFAALLLATASSAFAQAPAAPAVPAPGTPISRAQGEEMVKGMFGQVDLNHDGVVDATEQTTILDAVKAQGAPEQALASIRRMFSEGAGADGKVTLASFVKARMAAFDKADANHDGTLDGAEQAAARAAAEKAK